MSNASANRNIVIVIVVAAFLCVCLCTLGIAATYINRSDVVKVIPALEPVLSEAQPETATPFPRGNPVATRPPTRTPRPTGQLAATEVGSTLAPTSESFESTAQATSSLEPEIAESMDEIQQQVIQIRGLQPSGTFTRDVLTPDQLRQNVLRDFNRDNTPEDIRNEVIELSTLGLLAPDFDLGTYYTDLLSEQIAGYYDNETKEMYVVGNQFGGMERLTYSHEYIHALQDQNYDIQNGLKYDTEYCRQDLERCAGVQALLEGDASLGQMDWFTQYATTEDYTGILEFYNTFQTPIYDSAPEYMRQDLLFPYEAGQKFVQALIDQGGWKAVDAAYANVPVSTEQIMHPERYPDDIPVIVPTIGSTATLGAGWQEIDHGVMGEWYTYLILSAGIDTAYRLDASTAQTAAEGRGGDAYVASYNEQSDEIVMALNYQWDTLQDADEFASALVQYATRRFGQPVSNDAGQTAWSYAGGYVIFRQAGQSTQWVLASSQAVAEMVWAVVIP